jgi:hypothetical protein
MVPSNRSADTTCLPASAEATVGYFSACASKDYLIDAVACESKKREFFNNITHF